jgi:NAD(P)-dependent dehydrogenase (short-subunit alcohol dehydrogenase family)
MERISFEHQVVIVTGAGSGFGRTYALDIAKRGGAVIVNDLGAAVEGTGSSRTFADQVVDEIIAMGGQAVASYDNVGTAEGARRIVTAALENYGRVDALINNAGNLRVARFEDVSEDDLRALLNTHLLGSYYVTQAVWPRLKAQKYGRVVFTTSGAGLLGHVGLSAYGAAKGGVAGLMHVLSEEGEQHGILCNAVHPNALGRMSAKMGSSLDADELAKMTPWSTALGRAMQPDFTTAVTVYLASSKCSSSHSIYSSLGGRYSRVFIGVTRGWQGSREQPSVAEDVAAHINEIRDDKRGYDIPTNLMDEFRLLLSADVQAIS